MKCSDVRVQLDLFYDNEISVERNLEILKHLDLCAACRTIYEGEQRLREALRRRSQDLKAPARLAGILDRAPRRRHWAPVAMLAAAAGLAAVVAIAAIAGWLRMPPRPGLDGHDLIRVAAAIETIPPAERHEVREATDDVAARANLASYFAEVGGRACLHDLSSQGYRHVAGGILNLAETAVKGVCWTRQEMPGRAPVFHFNLPAESFDSATGEAIHVGDIEIRRTVRPSDGRTCIMIRGRGYT